MAGESVIHCSDVIALTKAKDIVGIHCVQMLPNVVISMTEAIFASRILSLFRSSPPDDTTHNIVSQHHNLDPLVLY